MDDEVLGCSSFFQEKNTDKIIFYTTSKHAFVQSETLKKEHEDLIKILGCKFRFMSFDAVNQLDVIPSQKLLNEFENLIMEIKPDTVLLTNPSYNQDHRAIYEAMLTALRPHDKIPFVKKIFLYEQPETFGTLRKVEPFRSTYYRPLNIEFKIEAIKKYHSQIRGHRSEEHIRTIAKLRGMQSNMEYAEAFEIVRWVE
jgi:N-acetylglucosamine malate deacetylase 1